MGHPGVKVLHDVIPLLSYNVSGKNSSDVIATKKDKSARNSGIAILHVLVMHRPNFLANVEAFWHQNITFPQDNTYLKYWSFFIALNLRDQFFPGHMIVIDIDIAMNARLQI